MHSLASHAVTHQPPLRRPRADCVQCSGRHRMHKQQRLQARSSTGKVDELQLAHESLADALARAKGYPYARPASSFVFVAGPQGQPAAYTFDNAAWVPPPRWQGSLQPLLDLRVSRWADGCGGDNADSHSSSGSGGSSSSLSSVLARHGICLPHAGVLAAGTPLTPILAIGSNAGPAQLARKFPVELFPDGVVVPVTMCVLQDFDVVFAPLISSYGSATATLEHSPGTDVAVFATYLTPALQQRMHETEGAYSLVALRGVSLREGLSLQQHSDGAVQPVRVLQEVLQYNHQCGTLHLPFSNPGSSPVALAEIEASGRCFPALSQVEMQAALQRALADVGPDHVEAATHPEVAAPLRTLPSVTDAAAAEATDVDAWIAANLANHTLRRARVAALTAAARPFAYEDAEVQLVIGTSMSTSVK